ncbi:unnamed protein product [Rhizophagus irregularis]|nr:unnamed protein product [Rhizophagus irregularis]
MIIPLDQNSILALAIYEKENVMLQIEQQIITLTYAYTIYTSQKDLEVTLVTEIEKGDATKWPFRTFKEVKGQIEKKKSEEKSSSRKRKEALFERQNQERNLSLDW